MRTIDRALLAAILMLLQAGLAGAEHTYSPCSSDVTAIGAGPAMLYLLEDHEDGDTWLYAETNGHPWVQRGGIAWHYIGQGTDVPDDHCWDIDATGTQVPDPDLIVL